MIAIDRHRLDPTGRPIRPESAWFELSARHAEDARRAKDLEEKIFADSAPFAGAARFVLRDLDAFGV